MSPHGNPEEPASSAAEIKREAPKVSTSSTNEVSTSSTNEVSTGSTTGVSAGSTHDRSAWGLWEVFVRSSRGLSHVHAGSLHAPDAAMALRNARDLYTRRNEGVSIWVVPAEAIASSDPDSKGAFFESPQGKDYRHATYYTKSEGVKHL